MKKIDKNNSVVSVFDWNYESMPILELKKWIDTQIELGKSNIRLNVDWGYYNEIDGLEIIAED